MERADDSATGRLSNAELLELQRWNTPAVYNGWEQITQSDAGIRLHHAGANVAVGGALTPVVGQWAHVAATFDGTTGRLYVNGVEVGSGPFNLGNNPAAQMRIGSYNDDSPTYNGDIDEVRIYNRALTPEELSAN